MKEKILYLILGILIGAVITGGCFLAFSKNHDRNMKGDRPDMPDRMEMRRDEDGNFIKPDRPNTNTVPEDVPDVDTNSL